MIVFFLGRKSGKYIEDCSSCQGCQSCDVSSGFCCELFEVIKKSKVISMFDRSIVCNLYQRQLQQGKMCLAKSIKHVSQFKLSFMSKVNPF